MARIWIRGGDSPVFRVSRPGYDATNMATPAGGLSFDMARIANGTLYAAGHVTESTVQAQGGELVAFPDFGYIPQTRVLARALYSGNKITNVLIDAILTNSAGISRLTSLSGPNSRISDYYYFIYTERI